MLSAKLHSMGFPYRYCLGEVDNDLVNFFLDWINSKDESKGQVVFLDDPFTDRTIVAMRSLGVAALAQGIPGRYITDTPFEIKENYIYIIPYADYQYVKIFPIIVVKGALAWVFNYDNIDVEDLHSRNSFCVNKSLPKETVIDFEEV